MEFGCGDARGERVSKVLKLAQLADEDYRIRVDTQELIAPTMLIKRVLDRFGNAFRDVFAKWRKLRTYKLVDGEVQGVTSERIAERQVEPQSEAVRQLSIDLTCSTRAGASRPPAHSPRDPLFSGSEVGYENLSEGLEPRVSAEGTGIAADICVVDFCSSDSDDSAGDQEEDAGAAAEGNHAQLEDAVKPEPTTDELDVANRAFLQIPTHAQRRRIRHQATQRTGSYYIPRSRKRRVRAKRAIVRCSTGVYHAHPVQASIPDLGTVPWPDDVKYIPTSLNPDEIHFKQLDDLGTCGCTVDSFRDECHNATSAVFCQASNCNLGGECSNTPRDSSALRLFETVHAGIGVYTMATLYVGDIIGEYCNVLAAYEGVTVGDTDIQWKQTSGYTLLQNKRATDGKYVYVEPNAEGVNCAGYGWDKHYNKFGLRMRFLNHACGPNAQFVEMEYLGQLRVVVWLLETIRPESQVTVSYGSNIWFPCQCSRHTQANTVNKRMDEGTSHDSN
ncbi:unnamed protein product [Phytophthora fragariaefolia]|uniref:Unnamed protein product n=1 Tax=Phytophthora fragariaefolia TaxID=1490495 RepID=A0A9W6UDQ6_9STRA|nr:unnamed protein product [Phytophthora fragariaefolia]